jgi:oxygen-dependent protoporphyrinogen oxidase
LTSGLLPPIGMLRLMLEPLAKRHSGGDETVFDFAARRIGRHAAEILVDAMVTGVFAGDSRQLSLAATFPKMAAMEAEHGSLTRALVARMRAARRAGGRSAGPAGPGGTLTTFANGMEELPTALATRLGDRLRLNTPVRSIVPDGRIFRLETDSGSLEAEAVLLTVPARTAAGLLAPIAPAARESLEAVATVPIAVIMTSYPDDAFGHPLGGFGFLVPRGEHLGILGTLFCHAIFPGQAPSGRAFLRTMVGGAREPEAAGLSDEELLSRVRAAHARVLGADPEPARFWVVRWPEGISQYTVGHLQRVATAESAAHDVGLELAGSPYRGVSVNDCITQARAAAGRIATRLGTA